MEIYRKVVEYIARKQLPMCSLTHIGIELENNLEYLEIDKNFRVVIWRAVIVRL